MNNREALHLIGIQKLREIQLFQSGCDSVLTKFVNLESSLGYYVTLLFVRTSFHLNSFTYCVVHIEHNIP